MSAIEAAIVRRLHQLDERRKAEVLVFIEFLAAKSLEETTVVEWPQIDPSRDLAKYIGVDTGFPDDAVAYQRQIRDSEWP